MTSNESEASEKWNWKFFDKVEGLDSKKMENCFQCAICVSTTSMMRTSISF